MSRTFLYFAPHTRPLLNSAACFNGSAHFSLSQVIFVASTLALKKYRGYLLTLFLRTSQCQFFLIFILKLNEILVSSVSRALQQRMLMEKNIYSFLFFYSFVLALLVGSGTKENGKRKKKSVMCHVPEHQYLLQEGKRKASSERYFCVYFHDFLLSLCP